MGLHVLPSTPTTHRPPPFVSIPTTRRPSFESSPYPTGSGCEVPEAWSTTSVNEVLLTAWWNAYRVPSADQPEPRTFEVIPFVSRTPTLPVSSEYTASWS